MILGHPFRWSRATIILVLGVCPPDISDAELEAMLDRVEREVQLIVDICNEELMISRDVSRRPPDPYP